MEHVTSPHNKVSYRKLIREFITRLRGLPTDSINVSQCQPVIRKAPDFRLMHTSATCDAHCYQLEVIIESVDREGTVQEARAAMRKQAYKWVTRVLNTMIRRTKYRFTCRNYIAFTRDFARLSPSKQLQ